MVFHSAVVPRQAVKPSEGSGVYAALKRRSATVESAMGYTKSGELR